MTKIITVTANTAIDLVIEAEGLYSRDNLIAENSREYVCGKGINVAKAVESLGYPVVCLGFAGRQSIGAFDALNSNLMRVDLIPAEGKTRTNITLIDRAAERETHIRTAGYRISRTDAERLETALRNNVEPGDIVILSGSLPPGAPNDFYRSLIGICRQKSATTLLDSSGISLAEGLKAGPNLVKPNLPELEGISGSVLKSEREILAAARALVACGVEKVCVSLGEKGVLAADAETAFTARVCGIRIDAVSQIGCGDALVAGLAVGLLGGQAWEDCVRTGIAAATANLASPEPGRFDRIQAERIRALIDSAPLPA